MYHLTSIIVNRQQNHIHSFTSKPKYELKLGNLIVVLLFTLVYVSMYDQNALLVWQVLLLAVI